MFTKKSNTAIEELRNFLNAAPEKISKCNDLGAYMATVRGPLNLRLIDLALGINLMEKGDKRQVRITKTLKDDQALEISKLLTNFIAECETPFMESLDAGDDGIPLVQGIEMPTELKKSKKGIISLVFKGSDSAAPLCQQLLTAAAIQELIVFGKAFHKKVLRNRLLIGAGVTIALVGLTTAVYFLVIKKHKAEKDDCCDGCCGCDDLDEPIMDGIELEATEVALA